MADKIVALLHGKRGPRVYTGNFAKRRVIVTGALQGSITVESDSGDRVLGLKDDMTLSDPSVYTRINYDGPDKVIVHIASD